MATVTGIYAAILTSGWVRHELAAQLVAFLNDRRYKLELHFSYDRPTPSNRNGIVKRFLKGTANYLLMIDHDTVPYGNPLDFVERDLDVVTFPYPIWRHDATPPITLSLALEAGSGPELRTKTGAVVRLGEGVREVMWGGTGMVLIAFLLPGQEGRVPDLVGAVPSLRARQGSEPGGFARRRSRMEARGCPGPRMTLTDTRRA